MGMKTRSVAGIAIGVIVGIAGAVGAAVVIPHTFTSGSTAVAAHVNENFVALADAINALADRKRLAVVDADGKVVGDLIQTNGESAVVAFQLNGKGTLVEIDVETPSQKLVALYNFLLFTTADCTGTAYLQTYSALSSPGFHAFSSMLAGPGPADDWYTISASKTFRVAQSSFDPYSGQCSVNNTEDDFHALVPLSAAQSQILNGFTLPLSLKYTSAAAIYDLD